MLCTVPAEVQLGCVLSSTVTPETRAFFCGGRPCPVKGEATVMSNVNGKSGFSPTESRTTCTVGNLSRGSPETPAMSVSSMEGTLGTWHLRSTLRISCVDCIRFRPAARLCRATIRRPNRTCPSWPSWPNQIKPTQLEYVRSSESVSSRHVRLHRQERLGPIRGVSREASHFICVRVARMPCVFAC